MLHRTLTAPGEVGYHQPHVPKKVIERSAAYTHSSTLGHIHFHKEANYRKKPLGFAAYSMKNMDIWGNQSMPLRHIETKMPGTWFAGGHVPLAFNYRGRMARKWFAVYGGGVGMAMLNYTWRMHKNGWELRNRGAVYGME